MEANVTPIIASAVFLAVASGGSGTEIVTGLAGSGGAR
jgi:hypothetical protein